MINFIENNAYRVLGLDISSNNKDILKRSKEIINRLKIDDLPNYDLDLTSIGELRSEKMVKEAVQKLQSPKKKIAEYFFWFCFEDDVDENVLNLIQGRKYSQAIKEWQAVSSNGKAKSFTYKRKLANLYCLLLCSKHNKKYLHESIVLWKELTESNKFWNYFSKKYALDDDKEINRTIINDFRKELPKILSDIYAQFYQKHKKVEYISQFQDCFSSRGEIIEKSVLAPIFQIINAATEELEELNISEDGVFDAIEKKQVKKLIGIFKTELNKIIDLGLYDDSQTKIMRDKVASVIKTTVLDIHNNLSETDSGIELLNVALIIVGTSGLKAEILNDISFLKELKSNQEILQPIMDLINNEEFAQAHNIIKSKRKSKKRNKYLEKNYDDLEKLCVSSLALEKYNDATQLFFNQNEGLAKPIFEEIHEIVYENIGLFNFNKEAIDDIIKDIHDITLIIPAIGLDRVSEYRDSFLEIAKDNFEGQYEEGVLIALIDSNIYGDICFYVKNLRFKNMVKAIAWRIVAVLIVIFLLNIK